MASKSHSEDYEEEHVHSVYEQIASHFSSTRYKPWPIIERYLEQQPDGAIGVDVGCGNGKYLAVNPNIFIVGSDRSANLIKFATQHEPHTAVVADILNLPHPQHAFDFAISIAVVHHLSTRERRREAIKSILEVLKPSLDSGHEGSALIYVWALEQENSRRGWHEGDEQDVIVPWLMKGPQKAKNSRAVGADHDARGNNDRVFQRYYHLYRKGELEDDVRAAGGDIVEAGYEKDNWWAVACSRRCA